jgi:hypothetical protein
LRKTLLASGLASGLAIAGILGAVGPAHAGPNGGAQVHRDSGCDYFPDPGVTICEHSRVVFKETQAANGNTTFLTTFKSRFTGTYDNGEVFTQTDSGQNTIVWKAGEQHVFTQHATFEWTDTTGLRCVLLADEHYANGEWQFDDVTLTCD